MSAFLKAFALNTWEMVAEMAPYLIFGFAIAGLLHILIRKEQVQRLLGKPGLSSVLKSCAIGVPMPLCSCSVIPVAASLRKSGASRGATAAFLSSTPQTGVDSILATYALMGGLFTAVRVAVAFVSGIVTGFLIELFCKEKVEDTTPSPNLSPSTINLSPNLSLNPNLTLNPNQSLTPPSAAPTPSKITSMSMIKTEKPQVSGLQPQVSPLKSPPSGLPKRSLSAALRYGFINLPADLAVALLVGLGLAGLITTLLPADLISGSFSTGPLAFLLATVISLPLYICATASIPMAYALMAAGLSPGAALIFLITGPATNTTTVVTIWKLIGRKATLIYLGCLTVIAWLAGWLLNSSLTSSAMEHAAHDHADMQPALWQHASGVALIVILFVSLYTMRQPKQATKSCCCAN
ncbi:MULTISPECIES: SO_0444 family Cu/Zn efflux transporter [unclassified Lentimonas]|uniref:SO_0444 family Cu/Zn efflux transporter n=1 Tax=unclassified Lentimonas TaxID=2630993 RepID=UPI00132A12B4|nr:MULTISPECIES: SO_0444 family Cu/Zn efflux transporter [unclassified Lentimonas]CAA6678185.1 Transporter [Lentimonas sp. CC4]CAA6685924.1 Transporter [Lentimonas sp. CC6]CAA7075985.1 Transporter [Lentimonas sp. CC4]CAA7168585.1 Transporter [Lentimonas sp. CC21]CAA7180977.1 Transporter [Lentimonas sp. CC8]